MQSANRPDCCMNCDTPISEEALYLSTIHYGYPLCTGCEVELKVKLKSASREATKLYFSLRKKGVRAELEKHDGYKHTDIRIAEARLDIEVDAPHHSYNPFRAIADLKQSFFAFRRGYNTLKVPNALVAYDLDKTSDYIADFIKIIRIKYIKQ